VYATGLTALAMKIAMARTMSVNTKRGFSKGDLTPLTSLALAIQGCHLANVF
jgi:hypothetical protein